MKIKEIAKWIRSNTLALEISVVILVVLAGALAFHRIEGYAFLDSLYFVVMTMSTIGYGDITPQTSAGKIMIVIYAFIGVPVFLSISGLILESRFNKRIKKYVNRVYREMQYAEEELEKMEKKVNQELNEVIEAEITIKNTERKVQKTKKEVEAIQETIQENREEDTSKEEKNSEEKDAQKPRWKRIIKR